MENIPAPNKSQVRRIQDISADVKGTHTENYTHKKNKWFSTITFLIQEKNLLQKRAFLLFKSPPRGICVR